MSAMQKEADHVYKWLTSDKNHLKKNCSKRPPYDWGDIMERSKDEAISAIARNGTELTSYYWNLAGPTEDCSNWLAKWFLYHKFRYRDGRNRHAIIDEGRHPHSSGSKHSHHKRTSGSEGKQHSEHDQDQPYYPETHSRTTIHGACLICFIKWCISCCLLFEDDLSAAACSGWALPLVSTPEPRCRHHLHPTNHIAVVTPV
jgi:hypothetical protein